MIKAKKLGHKSGEGFFLYNNIPSTELPADNTEINPAAIELIARWAKPAQNLSDDEITRRLLMPMVAEAARILEEGRVRDSRDIDLGTIFGLGFPAYRGGLLWWANSIKQSLPCETQKSLEKFWPRLQKAPVFMDLPSANASTAIDSDILSS
jgi:3-hydroxyacyl-CoA dehydrogenase